MASKTSSQKTDRAADTLQIFFKLSFLYWAGSVAYGLAESGSLHSFLSTLALCPLLGGVVPPVKSVPLWAYGMGHVIPGVVIQVIGTCVCYVLFPSERRVPRDDAHALLMTVFALGGSAPFLAPMHRAFMESQIGLMYNNVAQFGWVWIIASFFIQLFVTETWFYWVHRLMHTPWLYAHIHKAHHIFNPSFAASASSFHPADVLCLTLGGFVTPLILPLHRGLHSVFLLSNLVSGALRHLQFSRAACVKGCRYACAFRNKKALTSQRRSTR
jgi:hypothetical protein